jgi:hypothetical protein
MKTIQEIENEFKQTLEEVTKINGITTESAVQVATIILQESGKDRRAELYRQAKMNKNNLYRNSNNSNQPATDKQKGYMKNLGIDFNDNITISEASEMIEQAKAEKKKGRLATAPSF